MNQSADVLFEPLLAGAIPNRLSPKNSYTELSANLMLKECNLMIPSVQNIDSLSNFKRRTSHYLRRMKKTGQPLVLTVNGKAQMVVQDAQSFQRTLRILEKERTIEAIRESLRQFKEGKSLPLQEALARIEKNLGYAE